MLKTATGLVMRGDLGIPIHHLDEFHRADLATKLTRMKKSWDEDDPPEPVCCLRHADCRLWLPRFYGTSLWDNVEDWGWTEGEPYAFTMKAKLDPERGQPTAVPAMVNYLKRKSGGILIAPTGTGKTLMGCAIAAAFNRKIGVPVYVGHMLDNWVFHAKSVLGLTDADIGIVKAGRCDLGRPITLLSVQTIISRGVPEALQKQIGFLVCDEVHRYGAKVWREIVAQFPAKYRLGLTAELDRKDQLEDIVSWSFGEVGHTAPRVRNEDVKAPEIIMPAFTRHYDPKRICKWKKDPGTGAWAQGKPDPNKYDKLLFADRERTKLLAVDIVNAARKGRQILVLSRFIKHLVQLRLDTIRLLDPIHPVERVAMGIPYPDDHQFIQTAMLEAGMGEDDRAEAQRASIIFATYMMARDALNVPKLDTLFFGTTPGDVLQPLGRLREKVEGVERRPLMAIDPYEVQTRFSLNRAKHRQEVYARLGCKVKIVTRTVTPMVK